MSLIQALGVSYICRNIDTDWDSGEYGTYREHG